MNSIFHPVVPVPLGPSALVLPMAGDRIHAGFPSPAEDLAVRRIDLTAILVKHPQATYLVRVCGDSMKGAGIFDGDTLVVDKAVKPQHQHIVVAVVDGEFTVKYLYQRDGHTRLQAANPAFADIIPNEGQTIEVWGVVTSSITQFRV